MGHDDARLRRIRCRFWQALGDVFAREAVEAVTPDPLRVFLRDRKTVGKFAMAAMEGGVETGDLRQIGPPLAPAQDRRQVFGLVEGARESGLRLQANTAPSMRTGPANPHRHGRRGDGGERPRKWQPFLRDFPASRQQSPVPLRRWRCHRLRRIARQAWRRRAIADDGRGWLPIPSSRPITRRSSARSASTGPAAASLQNLMLDDPALMARKDLLPAAILGQDCAWLARANGRMRAMPDNISGDLSALSPLG